MSRRLSLGVDVPIHLALDVEFWLPYVDVVAQRRAKDLGRPVVLSTAAR